MPATATAKRSVTSRAKTASNKKAAAQAAEANGNGHGAARRSQDATLELAKQIKQLREGGASWADVKEKLGVDPAQGQYLIKVASVRPKDRITFTDDADLAKQAKALRKDGLSKAEIAARAGVSVGHVRKLLPDDTGRQSAKPAAKPAAKRQAAKPASKAKATPARGKADAAKGEGEGEGEAPRRRRRRRSEVVEDPSAAA